MKRLIGLKDRKMTPLSSEGGGSFWQQSSHHYNNEFDTRLTNLVRELMAQHPITNIYI